MDPQAYFDELDRLFVTLFEQTKQGQACDDLRAQVQGFVRAGEVLGLLSRADSEARMAAAHQQVFQQSIQQRQAHKAQLKQMRESGYRDLETPAIHRRHNNSDN
ncbi:hypothetical protein [Ferrimonas marina]|uniref:Uncharacterized protein n=1 Tax=Ferrimonas marina TaxID=299255 RepID=A0A1M5X2W6_9GAMM|nr:hypothetical protein [Ferrimonas marina]SHH94185.1 hypothetical protein SAMN02745129_3181 [Ferrimonas marina]